MDKYLPSIFSRKELNQMKDTASPRKLSESKIGCAYAIIAFLTLSASATPANSALLMTEPRTFATVSPITGTIPLNGPFTTDQNAVSFAEADAIAGTLKTYSKLYGNIDPGFDSEGARSILQFAFVNTDSKRLLVIDSLKVEILVSSTFAWSLPAEATQISLASTLGVIRDSLTLAVSSARQIAGTGLLTKDFRPTIISGPKSNVEIVSFDLTSFSAKLILDYDGLTLVPGQVTSVLVDYGSGWNTVSFQPASSPIGSTFIDGSHTARVSVRYGTDTELLQSFPVPWVTPVPEPSSGLLLCIGLLVVQGYRRMSARNATRAPNSIHEA
jgi:hypothetical protein